MKTKTFFILLIIALSIFSLIYHIRDIRIAYYDNKDIPQFEMDSNYEIVTDGKWYYLRRSFYDSWRYYNGDGLGEKKDGYWFELNISDPKKLVSHKHALWIYYKHIYIYNEGEHKRFKEVK